MPAVFFPFSDTETPTRAAPPQLTALIKEAQQSSFSTECKCKENICSSQYIPHPAEHLRRHGYNIYTTLTASYTGRRSKMEIEKEL